MNSERWLQIEQIYHAARERALSERDRFLEDACAGDEELRVEVKALLGYETQAETFLEESAPEVTARALAERRAKSMIERVIGPYKILALLGAGGMGEVYRARDSRIGRDVAIKVLPPAIARDRDRLRRFEQEARAAGALNHPNILTIYDVGLDEGVPYLVCELLEGETLRDRLHEGALQRRKAVEYARQIALGLAAAHDKGITHRDLKPENVFLTRDGRIKILDFGLAKLTRSEAAGAGSATTATDTRHTTPGNILGTPGYMSPEQVRDGLVDHRSDLFNLGAILYEMLTGRHAFQGNSTVEVLNAILKEEPNEISLADPTFDAGLARLLRRCLDKSPHERFQSALDLAFDLEALAVAPAVMPQRRSNRTVVAAVVAVSVLLPGSFWAGRKLQSAQSHASPIFHRLTYRLGVITAAKFAPDGQTILYSAAWDGKPVEAFSTRLGGPESRSLGLPSAGVLAISSAGELALSMGCELNWAECRGTLARMPLAGGAPREMLQDVFYADWAPDGKNLAVVRLVEGRFRLEYPIGKVLYETAGWLTYPRFSPKGDRIAFFEHPALENNSGSVAMVDLNGKKTTLSSGWMNLKGLDWMPAGDEVWFSANRTNRAQFIWAVTLAGKERLVLQAPGWMRLQEISRNGHVLLLQVNPRTRTVCRAPGASVERDLSWFDWSTAADLSRDGKTLLFYEWGEGVAGNPTVYLRKTDGQDAVRLGEGKALSLSPDGAWALALQTGPPPRLVLLPTGPGNEKRLPASGIVQFYSAVWFPDGKRILIVGEGPDHRPRSYVQDVAGGEARAVTDEPLQATLISPDGRFMAGLGAGGEYELRPVDGGEHHGIAGTLTEDELVQWSPDGRFLYVRGPNDSAIDLFRVDLSSGRREPWKRIEPADPVGLIGIQLASVHVTPDGKSYVYTYWKALTDLYLVDGLK
jgi:serine/threonine protein kinase/Tol biopolymer transport system component